MVLLQCLLTDLPGPLIWTANYGATSLYNLTCVPLQPALLILFHPHLTQGLHGAISTAWSIYLIINWERLLAHLNQSKYSRQCHSLPQSFIYPLHNELIIIISHFIFFCSLPFCQFLNETDIFRMNTCFRRIRTPHALVIIILPATGTVIDIKQLLDVGTETRLWQIHHKSTIKGLHYKWIYHLLCVMYLLGRLKK